MRVEVVRLSEKHCGIIETESVDHEYISCCNVSCEDGLPCSKCILCEDSMVLKKDLDIEVVEFLENYI